MKTLVFDTCLNKTYVALSLDGKIESKIIENQNQKYHSAFLISTIVDFLKKHALRIQDFDVFGVNLGPGSFTGIRACISVARVFAQQADKPLVGVSSLEILSKINKTDKNSLILLDARRKQVYAALYSKDGEEILAPCLVDLEKIGDFDLKGSFIISDEATLPFIKEHGAEAVDYAAEDVDLGQYLSEIVTERFNKGAKEDFIWAKSKPLYLQSPPVSCQKAAK